MELCIDFGGTDVKLAVMDDGRLQASTAFPVASEADVLAAAATAAHALSTRVGSAPRAVGIAVPGVVDPATQRMLHANAKYAFLDDFDLTGWACASFDAPAVVENDARAALCGETSTGSAAGERDVVLVTLGTGIGTAAMIDGIPLRGRSGHLTVDLHGPQCPCGNLGCGEALASTWALAAQSDVTMADVFSQERHRPLRDEFIAVWGAVVTTLVHSYDPAVVVLSGGILRAGDAVRIPVEAWVRDHLWPSLRAPRFVVPPQPELSVARGLSGLARAHLSHTDLEEK